MGGGDVFGEGTTMHRRGKLHGVPVEGYLHRFDAESISAGVGGLNVKGLSWVVHYAYNPKKRSDVQCKEVPCKLWDEIVWDDPC